MCITLVGLCFFSSCYQRIDFIWVPQLGNIPMAWCQRLGLHGKRVGYLFGWVSLSSESSISIRYEVVPLAARRAGRPMTSPLFKRERRPVSKVAPCKETWWFGCKVSMYHTFFRFKKRHTLAGNSFGSSRTWQSGPEPTYSSGKGSSLILSWSSTKWNSGRHCPLQGTCIQHPSKHGCPGFSNQPPSVQLEGSVSPTGISHMVHQQKDL